VRAGRCPLLLLLQTPTLRLTGALFVLFPRRRPQGDETLSVDVCGGAWNVGMGLANASCVCRGGAIRSEGGLICDKAANHQQIQCS